MEIYKKLYKNNKFKIWVPTWTNKFELPEGPYSVSNIPDYFQYVLEKYGEKTHNSAIRKYLKKIGNGFTFDIKTGYYLELLTPETMKLLVRPKTKIAKDENGENVPHLEITEVVLVCMLSSCHVHVSEWIHTP